ncbi:MAG: (2Fe-2S) ferredoxin domain-containing protein [Anaerolineae bacterium]|nr:(2Fe-2S) ferredoxin domain-containing protein [Anaerolineae bacterium]
MGSACHQYGVYTVLPALQQLMTDSGLDDQVALKGTFCLGPCMEGIVMRHGDRMILNIRPDNIEQKFRDEILPALQQALATGAERP